MYGPIIIVRGAAVQCIRETTGIIFSRNLPITGLVEGSIVSCVRSLVFACLTSGRSRLAAPVIALAMIGPVHAQTASEYDLKAAFLFNFTRFVDWPPNPDGGEFCIGIAGSNPFLGKLETAVSGRTAGSRTIVIKHMKSGLTAPCDLVFFSGTDLAKIRAALASIHTPTLTVGEVPNFARSGGIVEFSVEAHKVKLTINLDAAQRAHLQISSKLLSLASVIRDSD